MKSDFGLRLRRAAKSMAAFSGAAHFLNLFYRENSKKVISLHGFGLCQVFMIFGKFPEFTRKQGMQIIYKYMIYNHLQIHFGTGHSPLIPLKSQPPNAENDL